MPRRRLEEPNMSDNLLLVKVEDLINMAMGPADKNVVNYKLVQMVLHILARHLRMLETEVEIRMSEEQDKMAEKEKRKRRKREGSVDSSPRSPESGRGRHMEDIDERHERGGRKERDKSEKRKQKHDGATSKERQKEEKASAKEKEKAEQAATEDKDKTEKAHRTEKEKVGKADRMEKEKVDKADRMEKEKVDKADRMEKEKVDKADRKDREKGDKTDRKDREKSEKADHVEKGKADKADRKTKERAEKDEEKADKTVRKDQITERGREKGRGGSGTSIVITEKQKQKDKILVVEKGPTTRTDSRTRVGSIEVVTLSQFELLESAVNNLKALTGPLPSPALPDNKQLMEDIANGTASLTDIMQAMQVTARIQAAEQAISRMAGLLTQLAAAGAIPEELVDMVEEVKADVDEVAAAAAAATAAAAAAAAEAATGEATGVSEDVESSMKSRPLAARKSVAVDAITSRPSTARGEATRPARPLASTAKSVTSASRMAPVPPVTHKEMDDALRALKEELNKNMNLMTGKATAAADSASTTAKRVADKLDIALKLNSRISDLFSLVNDYGEQLSGFDTGLTSQMQGFQDQMTQMRSDLKTGMVQLSQAGGGGETTAVMELRERYDLLVAELDVISHEHQGLDSLQKQLADELRTLVESVEMLREQKADRDEVLDGLKDKADISRLSGLLTEKTFASIRADLERRLDLCHEKFMKQENVWMNALKELTEILENKAELMQLMATREETQQDLRDLHERLRRLAEILGDPMAAILTRQLARDATCGACMVPALMSPWDENYGSPPPLPAMRPRPAGAPAEEPSESCLQELIPPPPLDTKAHTCQRWVGGSHTLISDTVTKEKATPMLLTGPPTKRYTGYGTDGRLYMLEEELQPCVECNIILAPHDTKEGNIGDVPKHGAGDQGDVNNAAKK